MSREDQKKEWQTEMRGLYEWYCDDRDDNIQYSTVGDIIAEQTVGDQTVLYHGGDE